MMRLPLLCHAAAPALGVRAVHVTLRATSDGSLALAYELDADSRQLLMPPPETPAFIDGLWHHSCFEMFVAGDSASYREFNFSPSSAYAVYDFMQYRAQMTPLHPALPPVIRVGRDGCSVEVSLSSTLLALPGNATQSLGLAAVIEERGGRLSYWALHHAGPKPDFHRKESFVIRWPLMAAVGGQTS
jgi:hypothetical protein